MPRLTVAFAFVCALAVLSPARTSLASTGSGGAVSHIMVQLRGQPLGADPNLRARVRSTGALRLDAYLPAARSYASALNRYQDREVAYIRSHGIQLSLRRRFHVLFNGFDAVLPASQVPKLRSLANVSALLPIHRYKPLLDRSVSLIHAPEAWAQLGGGPNAGKGMMIADIDSGIDIKNPCFSDAGFSPPPAGRRSDTSANKALTNNKVVVAKAFGDADKTYSAKDAVGHGTFTAAIEACDYNTPTPVGSPISGVAPAAYLMNYNIFPDGAEQTSQDDPILPALEQALLDGADVINMSVGTPLVEDARLDADSQAVEIAIKAGVPVTVSAGNAGPTAQTISSPAYAPDAIAVGSTTNSHALYSSLSVTGPGDVPAALQKIAAAEGSYAWKGTIGPAKLVDVGFGRRPGDDPSSPSADDFTGKDMKGNIALIERGNGSPTTPLSFETKIGNAAQAGAIGAVIYDNRTELSLPIMSQGGASLPAVFVSESDGKALLDWVRAHPDAEVSMDSALSEFDSTPNILSDFSARGYGADYEIKPDLVAPGEVIYSATENETQNNIMYDPSGFTVQQGTSFSAPHVAGAVALLLQKHPTWTPAMVKDALLDTAGSDVYLDTSRTAKPSVMQDGAGLLNVGAALSSTAYVYPADVSYGEFNVGHGTVTRTEHASLRDAGQSDGSWSLHVSQLHGATGLSVSTSATVTLSANGSSDVPLTISASGSTPSGDYDGYIELQHGDQTLHLTYFVHVAAKAVRPGSVLLVDDTTSRFQSGNHVDVSAWYEKALRDLGKTYTYWNEATLGTPSLQDMKTASAVIVYTGTNFNGLAASNSDNIAGPLGPADVSVIHSYLDAGGRIFVTGMGATLSDPVWSGVVLGGVPASLSVYDNSSNDKNHKGKISPPRPSAEVDSRPKVAANQWIFGGLKPIDLSSRGDGAHDDLAIFSSAAEAAFGEGLLGVPGLIPISGKVDTHTSAYGQAALRSTNLGLAGQGPDVGIVSSDEPSFKHRASYPGRSVLFSFGFEGINSNTGYATRDQILQRVFKWFADKASVSVPPATYAPGRPVQLRATLNAGAAAALYQWQVGSRTLPATSHPTTYRFPHPGRYSIRVQVTDALGHRAVSSWTTVRVG